MLTKSFFLVMTASWVATTTHGLFPPPRRDVASRSTPTEFRLHKAIRQTKTKNQHTYRSTAMPLAPGEVVFTDPKLTFLHIPQSNHTIKITHFSAEVVDSKGASVPLNEVYNHHWLVFSEKQPNSGVCGGFLAYTFGVGAECRGTPTDFPNDYGIFIVPGDRFGANIHLLRTEYLADNATQDCIECKYHEDKGCKQAQSGSFACCGDGSFCPVTADAPKTTKDYFLQYVMEWEEVLESDDESAKQRLQIFVLDASNCEVEYNVKPSLAQPKINTKTLEYTVPKKFSGEIVYSAGHQHIGALNITLALKTPKDSDFKPVCVSTPVYGTGTEPGNEEGYLVKISWCDDNPVSVNPGDRLRVTSLYDVGSKNHGDDFHGGVMSLFYMAVHLNQ